LSRDRIEQLTAERIARRDAQIVERLREADEAAFDALYQQYFQRVYAFSFARLRNHADTDDAVQETFLSVYRSIEDFRGESSLLAWIYGIARNTVNNQLRRTCSQQRRLKNARSFLMRSDLLMPPGTPEDELHLQRCGSQIRRRLSSVADWQTEIFVLRHLENLSVREISKRMSRSSDSVRSSLYRVKRLMLEAIDSGTARCGASVLGERPSW
jgi:RNA polymerase sigma-70 factor (ECF subfamily)